ncbi:MAG: type I DNA topoisomerase [Moorellales bacterium]
MAKTLLIVESPAKARTLTRILGRNYVVKSSMGHVRDLPQSQFGVDVDHGFEPKYITIRGKGEVVRELREAAKKSHRVLLASDPDREGEAIAWHLQHLLQLDGSEPCRVEFHEITPPAVTEAVRKPRPIDHRLVEAQQARRVLDRLVGYSLSPLLWRKIRRGLSAGRVQSVAVRLICEREEEIRNFVPEEYWSLTAKLLTPVDQPFEARLVSSDRIPSREAMDNLLRALEGTSFIVEEVKKKDKRRQPPPPFITSTLQQEAAKRLNFTARRTMTVAQQLYEGVSLGKEGPVGLITYLRTDSTRVSALAQEEARRYVRDRFGERYLPGQPPKARNREAMTQDAHEAIRPTSVFREPDSIKEFLTPDQYRLYRLIWQRFLASQMMPAQFEVTTADIRAGSYLFRASGRVLLFGGFLEVYEEALETETEDENELPNLTPGMVLTLVELSPKQHFTQPPPRYTEASLVKVLEEKGIGRPSTYAPIIETILARGYVRREDKQFVPTELGFVVVNLLKKYFSQVIDVEFTAHMEKQLDLVEEGKADWREVVGEFYRPFQEVLARAESEIGVIEVAEETTEETCPKCGRQMVVKSGRFGKFLACPAFPECRTTKPYQEEIGVTCPLCGGKIVLRRAKKGRPFYGCSNYPQCTFTSWDRPTEKSCPECGERLFVKGTRSRWLKCSRCGHQEKEEPNENG